MMLFNNRSLVLEILSVFYNNLFFNINENIWLPRCEKMLAKEKQNNITRREKMKKCTSRNNSNQTIALSVSADDIVTTEYGLELEIRIGGSWLGFTMLFNRYNLSCRCVSCLVV